jgi:arginyl-tRNA synthetase
MSTKQKEASKKTFCYNTSMEEKIIGLINEALKKLGIEAKTITLEHPEELLHGDYSTPVALSIFRNEAKESVRGKANTIVLNYNGHEWKSPKDCAEAIAREVRKIDDPMFNKIEVAGPGFINFYLSTDFFVNSIKSLKNRVSITPKKTKEKVMVEYTDANPLKEFHIGHLMSNTVGEAVARLYEEKGNEVKRACYQGDVGMHIAKAVWGALKQKEETGSIDWVSAYPKGAKAFSESELNKKEIEEINKKIYNKDPELFHIYEDGRKASLEKFEEIYKKLGTKFDYYFFESEVADTGKKLVEDNIGKIFEKSEGAVVFHGEEHGLHTRVFINSQGIPTYEAKELGLAKIKSEKYNADRFVVITGNEIIEYFKVLKTVLSLIYPDIATRLEHFPHGMLRLPSGKMSSRTGEVITAESLVSTVEGMVLEKIQDRDFGDGEKKEIAEKVAIGAIKYSILKSSAGSDIIFDFDKSISFEGDSGPYLQYSYARAKSVIRKGEELGLEIDLEKNDSIESNLAIAQKDVAKISDLEKKLYRFDEVVSRSANELEPHYVTNFLTEIAGDFNSYYGNNIIVDENDPATTAYRITLTLAFANVMKKGMEILAIPVLERM